MLKNFLLNTSDINRSAYIWNTASGLTNAVQSIVFLVVIAQVVDDVAAGLFSIAWAIAYLSLTIGRYGMRQFQVTDAREEYSSNEYLTSRAITTFGMMLFAVIYIICGALFRDYSTYKCLIVLGVCVIKMFDSIEDGISSWYQQKNRLDVAAKMEVIIASISVISFSIALLFTKSLGAGIVVCIIITGSTSIIMWCQTVPFFSDKIRLVFNRKLLKLLGACLPLCIVSFLTTYIGNAPKYAIDSLLTEEMQAYYNYLFMPVFSIGLLSSLIFNPILSEIGLLWASKETDKLRKKFIKQIIIIAIITGCAIAVAGTIGIPVLNWLYASSLNEYKIELCILMVGGGLLALSTWLNIIIITIRKQKLLLYIYGATALCAKIISTCFVKLFSLRGAVYSYCMIMFILVCILLVTIFFQLREKRN